MPREELTTLGKSEVGEGWDRHRVAEGVATLWLPFARWWLSRTRICDSAGQDMDVHFRQGQRWWPDYHAWSSAASGGKLGSWSRLQSSKEILSPTWRLARRQLPRLLARRRQPWWWKVRRIRRRKPRWTRSHRLLRRPRNQSSRLSIGCGPEIGEVELPWEEGGWCAFAGKHIQLQDHIPEWALLAVEQGWGWSLWLRGSMWALWCLLLQVWGLVGCCLQDEGERTSLNMQTKQPDIYICLCISFKDELWVSLSCA